MYLVVCCYGEETPAVERSLSGQLAEFQAEVGNDSSTCPADENRASLA